MPQSIVYEVAPAGDAWVVRIPANSQSEAYARKFEAVARARQLATRDKAAVRVFTATGGVEVEYGPPGSGART